MINLHSAGTDLDGYPMLCAQLESLLADERDFIANSAQFSAFLFNQLGDLNWAGFYLNRNEELVLGPFQGQIACVRIPFGRGVCGAAAVTRQTQRVEDVHAFPGHIACDSASNSELVVPLVKDGKLVGVLDLDSPSLARFTLQDQAGIEQLAAIFLRLTDC
ncbi:MULTISPECIES: GAF domain-containing protein [unclassified Pseudomonas]|uniref:GAF domain-containing protein n=1 Tax=unclassified Pseudomonas TaxID=196821 RepID=UPI0008E94BE6|nr:MULTISPECIES: GAF domain-containing protein [unclassified Pseudomonas]PMV17733.1 GAF domain-containing protein [Pseudomonas sp. FW305-3-2-15-C-TSA2]PMV19003.1 GAF domain-containing protein [Pseudomonas sp. DP16D-L5]PMV37564.1 GAF domain-containing protein [Pseudomonas sp. FW305-3-2-15-A-LB2]PMV43539.1 GAF domain-containing protein [Pseudomonas sp. FW305-3-2-15-C-R2A1]PMV45433.1 GAF domain-containing protein [Pseudomonas sp. FW305-3-2-15-C-LB1]